jgi:uncharacterized membrane protein
MRIFKTLLKFPFAAFFIFTGTLHFTRAEFFHNIVPDYLPLQWEAVYVSGLFEILLGIMLMIPQTTRWGAWGLIALLIAVFPANIFMFQHPERFPDVSPTLLVWRLPLQGVMIAWAYWYTRAKRPRIESESENVGG